MIVAASHDGFSRASTSTTPRHWPQPCRSRHQVREATEGPFRHLPPIDCNCQVRPIDPFARDLLSGCANRKAGGIDAVAVDQATGDPRILVGERDGDNVGVSPPPLLA